MFSNTGEFAYKTKMEKKCKRFSFFRSTFENIESSGHVADTPGYAAAAVVHSEGSSIGKRSLRFFLWRFSVSLEVKSKQVK